MTDTNLLISDCNDVTASRFLAQSDAVVKTVIEVTPTPGVEVYSHSASISAKSSDSKNPSARIPVTDVSTAGPEPDVNKNNNVEEDEPNIIELKLKAEVDVELKASVPTPNGDGRYTTELVLVVTNTGNLSLSNVDLLADLAKMFPDGFEISGEITGDNPSVVLNAGYNGNSDTSLFDADETDGITSNLGVGDVVVVRVPVTFSPGEKTSFDLDAQVIADSVAGSVSDDSADDVVSGEDKATEISIEPIGVLGIAQSASPPREITPAANPADRCEATACVTTLTINVENAGNTVLENVTVQQLFGGVNGLPEGTEIVISSVSAAGDISDLRSDLLSKTFIVGTDDPIALLNGTDALPIGGKGSIKLVIEFKLPAGTIDESFELAAVGEAIDETGASVGDVSDNGLQLTRTVMAPLMIVIQHP